jgi:HEPN domain-containing protein
MDKRQTVQYYLKGAGEDWKTAVGLFEIRRYAHSLFFAHLALEKTLKAYCTHKEGTHPPYTHDLLKIANQSGLAITEQEEDFLDEVTRFNIRARYPEEKFAFYKLATRRYAQKYLEDIREWLQRLKGEIEG